jgi:hypothetical protein
LQNLNIEILINPNKTKQKIITIPNCSDLSTAKPMRGFSIIIKNFCSILINERTVALCSVGIH